MEEFLRNSLKNRHDADHALRLLSVILLDEPERIWIRNSRKIYGATAGASQINLHLLFRYAKNSRRTTSTDEFFRMHIITIALGCMRKKFNSAPILPVPILTCCNDGIQLIIEPELQKAFTTAAAVD